MEREKACKKPTSIKKKLVSAATAAIVAAELSSTGAAVFQPPQSQQLESKIFPPYVIAASYHPEVGQPGYFDKFTLDQTPRISEEQIAESDVSKWQPPWGSEALIVYPWTRNPEFNGGTWQGSYWIDNHSNPPNNWINDIMPIYKINPDGSITPSKQLYSADDPEYSNWVMTMAKHMNIPILFLSNWGINSKTDEAGQKIYEFAKSEANPHRLVRLAPLYELEGERNPKVRKLVRWVNHYKSYAKNNPFAYRNPDTDKLIISAYSDDADWSEMVGRWRKVEEITGVEVLLRPYASKAVKDFITGFNGPETFGAFPYRPAEAVEEVAQNGKRWKQISAKFEKFGETNPRLLEDPQRFIRDVLDNVQNPATLTTFIFDELGEGTALAPGLKVVFTPQGIYIDWEHSYGFLYVNILHNLLPPLPQIVSDFDKAFYPNKPKIILSGNLASKEEQSTLVWADKRLSRITFPAVVALNSQ